jgi:hypothetical protein
MLQKLAHLQGNTSKLFLWMLSFHFISLPPHINVKSVLPTFLGVQVVSSSMVQMAMQDVKPNKFPEHKKHFTYYMDSSKLNNDKHECKCT